MAVELFPRPATSNNARYQPLIGRTNPYQRRPATATGSLISDRLASLTSAGGQQGFASQPGVMPGAGMSNVMPGIFGGPQHGVGGPIPDLGGGWAPPVKPPENPMMPPMIPPSVGPVSAEPLVPPIATGPPGPVGNEADARRLLAGSLAGNPFIAPEGHARLTQGILPDFNMIDPRFWRYTSPVIQQTLQGLYQSNPASPLRLEDQNFLREIWRPLGLD